METILDQGVLEIDGAGVYFEKANTQIRQEIYKENPGQAERVVLVSQGEPLFLVSATDEISISTFSPRRWGLVAQADLAHPQLRELDLKIGEFWLGKGFDGFRIDAALSTFPDKIEHNWGLDTPDNLSREFVQQMRRIKPDCIFVFEGFERQGELLRLAGNKGAIAFDWQAREYGAFAITFPDDERHNNMGKLREYLTGLVNTQALYRESIINLGPEHDEVN